MARYGDRARNELAEAPERRGAREVHGIPGRVHQLLHRGNQEERTDWQFSQRSCGAAYPPGLTQGLL